MKKTQNKDLYSVSELTDAIIKEYQLPMPDEDTWRTYRQMISRTLKSTGIWDSGIPKTVGNKTILYFTEAQKRELLSNKRLYDYVRDRSSSEDLRNDMRYDDMIHAMEERKRAHIEFLLSQEQHADDYIEPDLSRKEYQDYKRDMMITAIFEKFFTPIDDNLLYNDLYRERIIKDDLNLQLEDIEAEKRLSHPNPNYYKDKNITPYY